MNVSRRRTWVVIILAAAILMIGCRIRGIGLDVRSVASLVACNAALLIGAILLRQRGWMRTADYFCASAQMALATAILTALSYVMASFDLPLQDQNLAAWDRVIGVDWQDLIHGFMRHPFCVLALNCAYVSFEYQLIVVLPLLFALGQGRSATQFVLAWCLALTTTVLVFAFVPAMAGYLYFGMEQKAVPLVRVASAWLFADIFLDAREAHAATLDFSKLDGIITFPSFHAATAVLLVAACWRVRPLRWLSLVVNIPMWVSAVPIGGHYVTDVLAGSLVGVASATAAFKI